MAKMQGMGKFDVELFDGKNNFSLWQSNVKDILVQQGLIKALKGHKPENMKDDDWEDLEMKAVSTIRLCLAPEVKYSVLNETSAVSLWRKLENMYMSKSLTNRLFLKKELYQLKMDEGGDIRDHLNHFTKLITQLSSIGVKVDDEDKALLLLSSLPYSYENLVTTLLVGKETLKEDDVIAVLLENEKFKRPSVSSEGGIYVARFDRGRSESRGNNSERENERSVSRPRQDLRDKECYYCHKKGHIKSYCKKLKADLEEFQRSKGKEKVEDTAATVIEPSNFETDLLLIEEGKSTTSDCWLMDSACSNHVCSRKEWFDTYTNCEGESVKMANGENLKIVGKGTVKVKMYNGLVKTFDDVRHVPTLGKNLISLGKLDALGCGFSARGGDLYVTRGSLVIMKGKRTSGNLYELRGETLKRNDIPKKYIDAKNVKRVYVPKKRVTFADVLMKPAVAGTYN